MDIGSPNKKQELVDRLAAYENTDLDPEQVKHVKETAKKYLLEKAQGKVGGWIPVEERLPEYGEPVLVRWKKGGILDHSVAQYFGMSWIRDREDFIFITIHGIPHNQGWEPIAWRPLPEPYRQERRGGE